MTNKTRTKTRAGNAQVEQLRREIEKLKSVPKNNNKKNKPFSAVGEHLGNMVGFKTAGRNIGGLIGRIFGSGDYTTNFDTINSNALTSNVPSFGSEDTVIIHREFIRDIISGPVAGVFDIDGMRINPTNAEMFPWLSTIAQNFDEYSIEGLVVEFKTTSGNAVATNNTALGSVIIATQYDPTKPAYINKQQMENYFFAQSTVPSQSMLHAVECKNGSSPLKSLYTYGGSSIDPRFVDYGIVFIATQGMQGTNVNLGELWVSYKIRLKKPRLSQYLGSSGAMVRQARGNFDNTNPLGTVNNSVPKGSLPIVVSPTVLTINQVITSNFYKIDLYWKGAAVSAAAPTRVLTGCIALNTYFGDALTSAIAGQSATSTDLIMSFYVQATGNSNVITITFGTAGSLPTGSRSLDISVITVESIL